MSTVAHEAHTLKDLVQLQDTLPILLYTAEILYLWGNHKYGMKMHYLKIREMGNRPNVNEGSLEDILTKYVRKELQTGYVIVEEKVDGSLFRMSLTKDRKFLFGSKEIDFTAERAPDAVFLSAIESATKLFENVPDEEIEEGLVIFFEFLRKPHHNALVYERTPKHNIIVLDVLQRQHWLRPKEKRDFAEKHDLEVVPVLWQGDGSLLTDTLKMELFKTQSLLGKERIEGIVVKCYDKMFDSLAFPSLSNFPIIGKYVRAEFKELNKEAWKHVDESPAEQIGEILHNENRWRKAVQHLEEKGELKYDSTDIAKLMKEIATDILTEEGEAIKKALFDYYWKRIYRIMIKDMPLWYKSFLKERDDAAKTVLGQG